MHPTKEERGIYLILKHFFRHPLITPEVDHLQIDDRKLMDEVGGS